MQDARSRGPGVSDPAFSVTSLEKENDSDAGGGPIARFHAAITIRNQGFPAITHVYQIMPDLNWRTGSIARNFRASGVTQLGKDRTMPRLNSQMKTAFVTWIAIWPSITVLLYILQETLSSLPVAVQTLILTAILVPWMSFVAMPLLMKRTAAWVRG
ncbi:MAG: hypothetical protein AAGE61_02915 [Pseudomonadota bacterium]